MATWSTDVRSGDWLVERVEGFAGNVGSIVPTASRATPGCSTRSRRGLEALKATVHNASLTTATSSALYDRWRPPRLDTSRRYRQAATMSDPTLVHVERHGDGVAVVRLDHPKVNALSSQVLRQLLAAAEMLADDPPGAVVVTGGDRVFAAGADISEFGGPDEAATIGGLFHEALGALADLPRATVAAVAGFALGGGCELALACDFRIASYN